MPKIVHFEITADNPQRAIDFYKDIFGWKVSKWDGPQEYWLIDTGDDKETGISGGISKRQDGWNSVYNTIEVDSVDQYAEKVKEAGGEIVTPKHAIPGVGYLIYCKDTENNMFGILHPDPDAK
jgi:predicted enzyme related to lactoylglutathione lyase